MKKISVLSYCLVCFRCATFPEVVPPGAARGRIEHLPYVLRRLRIRDLETLDWLGRHLSFARTAEEASITQPALSKWLRELEDTLGLPLFERTSRRVAPTAYGEAMLECAARVLTDLRTIQPAFDALKRGTSLPLKVGMLPYISMRLLPGVIEYLASHAPTQQINYTENTLDHLLPLMQRRELDMVVCRLESLVLTAGYTSASFIAMRFWLSRRTIIHCTGTVTSHGATRPPGRGSCRRWARPCELLSKSNSRLRASLRRTC
ncbi:hypothetical protein CBA19CS11_06790 [Caballeronia novacaledonica]|nr:hypothetical protein CBA19CS11_06790 [Caballeronia novacaledonica]